MLLITVDVSYASFRKDQLFSFEGPCWLTQTDCNNSQPSQSIL